MANNAPTNLDLSNCTTSIDEGKTSKKMSEWAKIINENTGTIADIDKNSQDTKMAVEDLRKEIGNVNLSGTYLKSDAFKVGNPMVLDNTGQLIGPTPKDDGTIYMTYGHQIDLNNYQGSPNPKCSLIIEQHTLLGKLWTSYKTWTNGTDAFRSVNAKSLHPENDAGVDLGMNDHAWNNVYSKTAVSVTSDASEKKVLANLDNDSDADNKKLLDAIYNLNIHTYKLNDSITEKGEDNARLHNGFIAQDVEKVLTDAGLNPSDYGMWIKSKVYKVDRIDTGKIDKNGKQILKEEYRPVIDENGNQVFRQSLRYEEVFSVLIQSLKNKINNLEKQIETLQQKNG